MSNQPPVTLGNISSELIIKILHCCDCPTILRFAATCKAYNELVAQSVSLQLQIELEANGLELIKGSFKRDATYSVILEDLRQFRDAWLDLNFGEPFVRPLGKSNMLLWELREGFYIKAFSQLNGQIPDALQFIPLDPETPDPLPLMFEFRFSEFTADPGQGLVAIISRDPTEGETSYIHLCSSTTGLAHPLAHYPILAFELDFAPPPFSTGFAIEIMGHTVLAKVSYSQDNRYELLIWNWKSGALLHRIASQEGMCDFTFLDQRHLVVLAITRSSLFQDSLALLVYAISDDISTHTTSPNRRLRAKDIPISEPVLRLEFPKIKELSKISETGFFLRSDPTPGRTIYTKSAAFGCPYSITLSMTFSFSASSFSWDVSPFYRVFVDGRSLLDCVRTNTYDSTKVLPWSSWGTAATRWFIAPEPPDHWICWMSGSRYIRPLSDVPYYSIFDFSSRTVGRFQERYRELYPTTSDRLVENSDLPAGDLFHDLELLDQYLLYFLEDSPYDAEPILVTVGADSPSIIPTCDPGFEGPIISELPYHLVCKANNEQNHEGWQINGDCIVGVASWGPPAEMITICKLKNHVTRSTAGLPMDSKPSSLSVISPELVIQILHYCEYPSILTFSATCKAYYELVTKSTSLQLHIELEANGLELVKGSFQRGATYSAILKDLRRFRDAWLDLDLTEPAERLVGKSGMLLWEMREGFYIRAFSRSGGRFSDALQIVPLDSIIPEPPPLTFDFTFNEFTADPGQELLAILSRDTERDAYVHVHLCSSATGLAHPLARYPRLTAEFDFNPPYFWPGFSIDVMGHIVLSKVSHPQDHIYELLIWDWRSGVLLHRISSQGGICDFTFLDQRHLVVLSGSRSGQERLDTLELLIYALSNDAPTHLPFYNGGQLRVVDFPISQPILSLEFPRIKESSKISETGFFLRSDPTPGRAIYVDSAAFACSYAVTLGMTFHFHEAFDNWESPPYYRALLDGRFLLDQIRENPGNETKVLPWSSWGTCATRWFIAPDEPDHWIAWMSGSRFITPVLNRPYYCIFDFSPPTVRRFRDRFGQLYPDALDHLVDNSDLAMADGFHDLERLGRDISYFCETSPSAHEFFAITVGDDNPSVIETDEYFGFEERIISRLPYRLVFKTNNRINHEGWQLIGDYIVGISSREASEVLTVYKLKK